MMIMGSLLWSIPIVKRFFIISRDFVDLGIR